MNINIENADKTEVVKALYNNARAQGMGFLHFTPEDMTDAEARDALALSYIDYFKGRVMKVDLSKATFNTWGYDRDNYPSAWEVLKDVPGCKLMEEPCRA